MKKIFILLMIILNLTLVSGALTENLTAYYSYDTGANDDYNSFNGVEFGTPTYEAGKVNNALTLSGTSEAINVSVMRTEFDGTGGFAVSLWVKFDTFGSENDIISLVGQQSVRAHATNQLQGVIVSSITSTGVSYSDNLDAGVWYHIVLTFDGDTHYLYLNHDTTLIAVNQDGVLSSGTSDFYIGASQPYGRYVDGQIDEVAFWNRNLSSDEVEELYNEGNGYNFLDVDNLDFFNQEPLNSTNINGDKDFSFNLTSTTLRNCTFSVDAVPIDTYYDVETSTQNFTLNVSDFSDGTNTVEVDCGGTLVEEKVYFFDATLPTIDYVNAILSGDHIEINGSTIDDNMILNISCTDDNLYYMNITISGDGGSDIDFNSYTEDINLSFHVNNDTVNIGALDEDDMNITVVCADAHTKESIPPMDVKEITGGLEFEGIKFYTTNNQLNSFTTTKLKDRHTFDLSFKVPTKSIEMIIDSPYENKYIKGKNSFLTGIYWYDFNNDQGFEISNMVKTGNGRYSLSLESPQGVYFVSFHSIGIININTYHAPFMVDVDDDYITLGQPNGTFYPIDGDIQNNFTLEFNYTPTYSPLAPDNCTLNLNGVNVSTDLSITKNVENTIEYVVMLPDAQENIVNNWSITCRDAVFHAPSTFHEHIHTTDVAQFIVRNTAPSEQCDICIQSIILEVGSSSDDYTATHLLDSINYSIQENEGNPGYTAFFNITGVNATDFNFTFVIQDETNTANNSIDWYIYNYTKGDYDFSVATINQFLPLRFKVNYTDSSDYVLNGLVQLKMFKNDYWDAGIGRILIDYFDLDIVTTSTTTTTTSTTTVAGATTTTTMLPIDESGATHQFQSIEQALFYIFLFGLWLIFYYLTFTLKGENGKPVGYMNIMQLLTGIVLGLEFGRFSWIIAFAVLMVAVGTFLMKAIYGR